MRERSCYAQAKRQIQTYHFLDCMQFSSNGIRAAKQVCFVFFDGYRNYPRDPANSGHHQE
jgi:hypothetical protein